MQEINHTNSKSIYLNENEKFDKEKYIEELSARLISLSDKILSYNPELIKEDRPELMYMEDGMYLWKTNSIRQLTEYDMVITRNLIERRDKQQSYDEKSTFYRGLEQNEQSI